MYVYLSGTRGYVFLPSATELQQFDEDAIDLTFIDADGNTIAVFQRRDVIMFSPTLLPEPNEDIGDEPQDL